MWSKVKKTVSACWRPVLRYVHISNKDSSNSNNTNNNEDDDNSSSGNRKETLMWSKDLEKHYMGEYSFAVLQANNELEDHSQVETGRCGTFVGVYDGHGGPDASLYLSHHLFTHFIRLARDSRNISEDLIKGALSATEDGFLTLVSKSFRTNPLVASIGSCCLVGVIWKGTLYVSNLGDSKAVIGSASRSKKIKAEQLTKEHNACMEEVREELRATHPGDSSILVMKEGVWRIKGVIQVSRSIGDAYLKSPDLALDSSFPRFHFPEPIRRPVLTAEPSMYTRVLQPNDQFLIFASDGLWEHLTNQEAVEIVYNSRRTRIAKRLVRTAQNKVAKRMKITFDDLNSVEKGERRKYHDDITVVVLFLDHDLLAENATAMPEVSVQGFVDTIEPSEFSLLRQTT